MKRIAPPWVNGCQNAPATRVECLVVAISSQDKDRKGQEKREKVVVCQGTKFQFHVGAGHRNSGRAIEQETGQQASLHRVVSYSVVLCLCKLPFDTTWVPALFTLLQFPSCLLHVDPKRQCGITSGVGGLGGRRRVQGGYIRGVL